MPNTFNIKDSSNVRIDPTKEATALSIKTAVEGTQTSASSIKTNTDTLVTNSNLLTFNVSNQLKATSDSVLGLATDDGIVLLRRMVKLMESQATVDSSNRQRVTIDAWMENISGAIDTGTATGTQSTVSLVDTTKSAVWVENGWMYYAVKITAGTGVGQIRLVASNTTDTLTLANAWNTTPDGTSTYAICDVSSTLSDFGAGTGNDSLITLADTTKTWTTNAWANLVVRIKDNLAGGVQIRLISSNTATVLTLAYAWTPNLSAVSVLDSGTATGAQTISTLVDDSKAWTDNTWTNSLVKILSGTGAGQVRHIASNSATIITLSTDWTTQPNVDSTYAIYPLPARTFTICAVPSLLTDLGTSAIVPRFVAATDSTFGTVTSITSLDSIGFYNTQQRFGDISHKVYNDAIRSQLTFT